MPSRRNCSLDSTWFSHRFDASPAEAADLYLDSLTFSSIQPVRFENEGLPLLPPPVSIWCHGKHQSNGRSPPSMLQLRPHLVFFCVFHIVRRKISKTSELILRFLWNCRIGAVFHRNLCTAFFLRSKLVRGSCSYGVQFPVKILRSFFNPHGWRTSFFDSLATVHMSKESFTLFEPFWSGHSVY